jgi:hypothetical protein
VAQLYAAATRAIRHTYEDDVDDASPLLALQARLRSEPGLAPARSVWLPPLTTAQRRAATLRLLGPTLRALRQALANAWYDARASSYRDVGVAACRDAFAQMPQESGERDAPLLDTVVTIEPLGTFSLAAFQRFCRDPRSLAGHAAP